MYCVSERSVLLVRVSRDRRLPRSMSRARLRTGEEQALAETLPHHTARDGDGIER